MLSSQFDDIFAKRRGAEVSKIAIDRNGNKSKIIFCDLKFKDLQDWDVDQPIAVSN